MKITIFTPTYNRAYILYQAYESLKMQSYKNFEWVLIDDGSSDETPELVEKWMKEGIIDIKYSRQENQGRFAAFNNAKKKFSGELVVWLDSDDYLLKTCLEKLVYTWKMIPVREECSGVLAYIESGISGIIGSTFPDQIEMERIYVLYDRYRITGDKFIALRNDLLQKYEYPIFQGENFTGDSILFNQVNDEYPMYLMREVMMHREYLNDNVALTNNKKLHHINSPNGMKEHYIDALRHEKYNQWNIIKHCIGYIAFSKLSGYKIDFIIRKSPKKGRTFFLYPLGILYYKKLITLM